MILENDSSDNVCDEGAPASPSHTSEGATPIDSNLTRREFVKTVSYLTGAGAFGLPLISLEGRSAAAPFSGVTVHLNVNGRRPELSLDARVTLLDALREHLKLTGTKKACDHATPEIETDLKPDELILSIDLPRSPYAKHSHYLKIRERASYAFALVSVAAALELDGTRIRSARLCLGGVAPKPWRSEEAERLLAGQSAGRGLFENAASQALVGAKTRHHNAFKVELAKRAVVRALSIAGANPRAACHP